MLTFYSFSISHLKHLVLNDRQMNDHMTYLHSMGKLCEYFSAYSTNLIAVWYSLAPTELWSTNVKSSIKNSPSLET